MIAIRQYTYILFFFFFASITSFAQNPKDPTLKPERSRELFHDYVDTEQKKALQSDGKEDKLFSPSFNRLYLRISRISGSSSAINTFRDLISMFLRKFSQT